MATQQSGRPSHRESAAAVAIPNHRRWGEDHFLFSQHKQIAALDFHLAERHKDLTMALSWGNGHAATTALAEMRRARQSAGLAMTRSAPMHGLSAVLEDIAESNAARFKGLESIIRFEGIARETFEPATRNLTFQAFSALKPMSPALGGVLGSDLPVLGVRATVPPVFKGAMENLKKQFATRNTRLKAILLAKPATPPLPALRAYSNLLSESATPRSSWSPDWLEATRQHGDAVSGLVAGDVITRSLAAADSNDDVLDIVEADVIAPWLSARSAGAEDLNHDLAGIDPKLAELHRGAWTQLSQREDGWLESASHLATEVVSRLIRELAPDTAVARWAEDVGLSRDSLMADGRFTRAARLKYISRNLEHKSEQRLLVAEADDLAKITTQLIVVTNGGKHASIGADSTVRANLLSVEAIATRLLSIHRQ